MLVRETISFQRGKNPKEVLGIGYVNKLKEDLRKLYSATFRIFNSPIDIMIVEKDKKFLVWINSRGNKFMNAIIRDVLEFKSTKENVNDILNKYEFKIKKLSIYDSLNFFKNKYKFHIMSLGIILECKYEEI
jgi:hypothetical protein